MVYYRASLHLYKLAVGVSHGGGNALSSRWGNPIKRRSSLVATHHTGNTAQKIFPIIQEMDDPISQLLVEYVDTILPQLHWLSRTSWKARKLRGTPKVQSGFVGETLKYRWWIPFTGRQSPKDDNVSATLFMVTEGNHRGFPLIEVDPPVMSLDAGLLRERIVRLIHSLHPDWTVVLLDFRSEENKPGKGYCVQIQMPGSLPSRSSR